METKNLSQEISETLTPPTPEKSTIRTMKGDVALAVERQKETLVSIALAEEKKKEARQKELLLAAEERAQHQESAPKPRGRIFIILSLLLVILLGVLGYFFVLPKLGGLSLPGFSNKTNTPEPVMPTIPVATTPTRTILTSALIPTQSEIIFSLKKETSAHIFSTIKSERLAGDISYEVKNIVITDETQNADGSTKTTPISANRLITLAGVTLPEILARSLQSTHMAGFIAEPNSTLPTPFLILKVSGYSTALAGMLEWEQKLPTLFDTVFGTNITAGLSPKTKTRDVVLLGRDSRVLEITPNVGIAYMFADPSTLVITGSRTALEKIVTTLGQ